METRLTLESLKGEFARWRQEKKTRSEAVPEELWNKALNLYPEYEASQICWQLRLEKKRLLKRLSDSGRYQTESSGFVQVQMEKCKSLSTRLVCARIELERPDGSRLRFYGQFPFELEIGELLNSFVEAPQCCR